MKISLKNCIKLDYDFLIRKSILKILYAKFSNSTKKIDASRIRSILETSIGIHNRFNKHLKLILLIPTVSHQR